MALREAQLLLGTRSWFRWWTWAADPSVVWFSQIQEPSSTRLLFSDRPAMHGLPLSPVEPSHTTTRGTCRQAVSTPQAIQPLRCSSETQLQVPLSAHVGVLSLFGSDEPIANGHPQQRI